MKRITLAAVTIAALAAAAAPAPAAIIEGSDPNATATFQGQIRVDGDQATLRVKYRCAEGQFLWVSAKQVASGKKDARLTAEGSSQISSAWWQSHRNAFTCNGRWQTGTFTIDKVEPGSKGTLKKGHDWVQFCVTKESEGPEGLILSASQFVHVK